MNLLVNLAKLAVETYIKEGKIIEVPSDLPKEFLDKKAGVFVTIEKITGGIFQKNKELKGCIGTYLPTKENIAEEIIYNAIATATEDYRFKPIELAELPSLSYMVYILNEPELIKDQNELNPKKYGIIIKTESGKSGLLLPDLEGVDTVPKQIEITCQKAGIYPLEKLTIYRFTVEKYQ